MIDSIVKYVVGKVRLLGRDGTQIGSTGDRLKVITGDIEAFGASVSMPRSSHIKANFANALAPNNIVSTVSGGASTSIAAGTLSLASTSAATASALVRSSDVIIYNPGREVYAQFTASFTTPTDVNSNQRAGLFDDSNGIFIGFQGTTFGVTTRAAGSDTFTSTFNGDALDGSATSKFTRNGTPEAVNRTVKNVWRIRFGWLGAAPVYFEVMAPDGHWVLFHTIKHPNTSGSPLVQSPILPMSMQVTKASSDATNLEMASSSWDAGIVDVNDGDVGGVGTISSLTPPNNMVTVNIQGRGTLGFNLTGTWVGTLVLEGNIGDGTWVSISGQSPQGNLVNSLTANQAILLAPAGFSAIRVRASAWTSGSAVVTWNASRAQTVLQG